MPVTEGGYHMAGGSSVTPNHYVQNNHQFPIDVKEIQKNVTRYDGKISLWKYITLQLSNNGANDFDPQRNAKAEAIAKALPKNMDTEAQSRWSTVRHMEPIPELVSKNEHYIALVQASIYYSIKHDGWEARMEKLTNCKQLDNTPAGKYLEEFEKVLGDIEYITEQEKIILIHNAINEKRSPSFNNNNR